jgi:hypothetical protein
MATKYPYPIKVDVSLVFRQAQRGCCKDFINGFDCCCGPLVTITTEAKSPAAVIRTNHWLEADNVWDAKNNIREIYYDDNYARTRMG